MGHGLAPLFDTILRTCRAHEGDADAPLQLQISALDYSTYVGRIGVGRINQGTIKADDGRGRVWKAPDGTPVKGRCNQVLTFEAWSACRPRRPARATSCWSTASSDIGIGVTITDPANPAPLPMLKVDEPTLTMNFCVNTCPLAGREGKFVTSRQIWDRLRT